MFVSTAKVFVVDNATSIVVRVIEYIIRFLSCETTYYYTRKFTFCYESLPVLPSSRDREPYGTNHFNAYTLSSYFYYTPKEMFIYGEFFFLCARNRDDFTVLFLFFSPSGRSRCFDFGCHGFWFFFSSVKALFFN